MRNVIATVVQTAAVVCLAVAMFMLSPLLFAGTALAVAGILLAPERSR